MLSFTCGLYSTFESFDLFVNLNNFKKCDHEGLNLKCLICNGVYHVNNMYISIKCNVRVKTTVLTRQWINCHIILLSIVLKLIRTATTMVRLWAKKRQTRTMLFS